jgi:hypothetical protein
LTYVALAGVMLPMAGIVEGLRKIRGAFVRMIGAGHADGDDVAGHGQTSSTKDATGKSPLQLHHNPRRYKRAMLLTGGGGIQQEIASASAQFRGRPFAVVDLSHTGVAIERGELSDADFPDASKPESIVLNVGMLEPFSVQATLARHSESVLAFEFVDVPTEGRLTIDRFLDPKMIGLNMRAVDRSFFSPGETFTLWFCGPRDTNFFLWMNGARLDRAIIQLGDEQFTLAPAVGHGSGIRFVRHNAPATASSTQTELRDSVLFALDVALQVKNGGDAIAGLVKLLTEAADTLQPGT